MIREKDIYYNSFSSFNLEIQTKDELLISRRIAHSEAQFQVSGSKANKHSFSAQGTIMTNWKYNTPTDLFAFDH